MKNDFKNGNGFKNGFKAHEISTRFNMLFTVFYQNTVIIKPNAAMT